MFREADIRAYHPKCDATPAEQPRRVKAAAPQKPSRSRYAIDPEAIAAGWLPPRAPVVTSAANPHYQKHFDRLFGLAKAGVQDNNRSLINRQTWSQCGPKLRFTATVAKGRDGVESNHGSKPTE
jgi:hypothetical protein